MRRDTEVPAGLRSYAGKPDKNAIIRRRVYMTMHAAKGAMRSCNDACNNGLHVFDALMHAPDMLSTPEHALH